MINADFLARVGQNTTVDVRDPVAVPSNTTSGVGDAGTTARSSSVSRATKLAPVAGLGAVASVGVGLALVLGLVGGVVLIGMS